MQRKELKLSSAVSANSAVKKKNMEMKERYERRNTNHEPSPLTKGRGESRVKAGSALILVVVLTSLLAIVGVMFVMVARVDRIATSAISENKTLDSAVEAVIARISQELVLDVPRLGQEYYDYPDANNAWLASLEPYEDGSYKWRQISDVTGFLEKENWGTQDIEITNSPLDDRFKAIIEDHNRINLDDYGDLEEQLADADGDGVADSKWIELEGINSSKGKTIYAAIRIIDNGGMLNVNTAYQFNPASPGTDGEYIDGSEQTQINLFALAQRSASNEIEDLDDARFGTELPNMDNYIRDVVWRYNEPNGRYTPFDISDELELRNRYLLNRSDIDSRIEEVWDSAFQALNYLRTPVDSPSSLGDWEEEVYFDDSEPNADRDYSYRHIGTTYNMDRIINPYGGKMVNVNRAGAGLIYSAIGAALFTADPNFKDIDEIAAQTAVNLIDFRDNDPNITTLDVNGITYYGFERPCVYISELAHNFRPVEGGGPVGSDKYRSYAVELYKPYTEDAEPNNWRLFIDNSAASPPGDVNVSIDWSDGADFHVIRWRNPIVELDVDPGASSYDIGNMHNRIFDAGSIISLQRRVDGGWISVDSVTVPPPVINGWLDRDYDPLSIQRDITRHKCIIRGLWSNPSDILTLGSDNSYTDPSTDMIQAHPEDEPFTNVGEIGMVFRENAYGGIGPSDTEADVRINLADPNYHGIFKYLTVWPPSGYVLDPNEVRIKGRININTAPWYVIAQLPWMTDKIAQAIVAYRDKLDMDPNGPDYYHGGANDSRYQETGILGLREADGFASIAELATVINNSGEDDYSMRYYTLGAESDDLLDYPDLSYNDGAEDDFEERDVIFARISNLVTVRSDVFTAYILVRIGADGPQKRVIAILDRSNVYTGDGRVQIVALHAVPDPR